MLELSVAMGVIMGASWLAGGLVNGGFEVTMGCAASRFDKVVAALELSSSSTTTCGVNLL